MSDCNVHEAKETCLFRFNAIDERLDRIEDMEEKKNEELDLIGKAIIEIQLSSQLTAQTLARLEQRFDTRVEKEADRTFKLIEKVFLVLAGIIGALLGVKLL